MNRVPLVFSLILKSWIMSIFAIATPAFAEGPAPRSEPQKSELVKLVTEGSAYLAPEDLPKLKAAWEQYKNQTKDLRVLHLTYTLRWLEAMAQVGTDEMWKDYLDWFRNKHRGTIPIDRLISVARPSFKKRISPLLISGIESMASPSPVDFSNAAQVAQLLGDETAIRMLVGRIRGTSSQSHFQNGPMWNQLRLRTGDPDAMLPVVSALPAADGKWNVQWSLCGVRDRYKLVHCLDIGGSALSGEFDIVAYAAPDSLHYSEVGRVEGAKSRGSVILNLPKGTKNIALGAINRRSREWRRSEPFTLVLGGTSPCEFKVPEKYQVSSKDDSVPEHPFGSDLAVHGIRVVPGETVEIATLPWKHGFSMRLSMWVCFVGKGTIEARILDPQGNLVNEHMFTSDPPDMMLPIWSSTSLQLHSQSEINPHKVVITAKFGRLYLDDPLARPSTTIWLTDLQRTDYEPNFPPAGTEIVGGAPSVVTAMTSDETGDFLALALKGGRLALMDTKTGAVRQSDPALQESGRFVAAIPGLVVALDSKNNVFSMDRSTMAVKKIGTLDSDLVPDDHPVFRLSPHGDWIVLLGRETDVYAVRLEPNKLGKLVRIPAGGYPEMMIDRKSDTLHVAGPAGKFIIPFGNLEGLNFANLKPQEEYATTQSVAEYSGHYRSYWVDPVYGIYTHQGGSDISFLPDGRFLTVPAFDSYLTVTPQGTVYISSSSGLIRRLDPATVEGYKAPEKPDEPMPGHNPALIGDDEDGDI